MKHQIGQKVVYNGCVYEVKGPSTHKDCTVIFRPRNHHDWGVYGDTYVTEAYDQYLLTEDEHTEKVSAFDSALKIAKEKMTEALEAVSLAKQLGVNGVGTTDVLSDIATDIADECGVEWNSSNC